MLKAVFNNFIYQSFYRVSYALLVTDKEWHFTITYTCNQYGKF